MATPSLAALYLEGRESNRGPYAVAPRAHQRAASRRAEAGASVLVAQIYGGQVGAAPPAVLQRSSGE